MLAGSFLTALQGDTAHVLIGRFHQRNPWPRGVATLSLSTLLCAGCESQIDDSAFVEVFHKDLSESSGLAHSPAREAVWFTHNDSGGDPELFSFTLDGTVLDVHALEGAGARDWEDIAAGPCPGSDAPCLYIADIGDNGRVRSSVQVYAAPVPEAGDATSVLAVWDLSYPGGAQNAETLLLDPVTSRLYIVTKTRKGPTEVYRLPQAPGPGELTRVASIAFDESDSAGELTTAGDWHPGGDRVVVRSYDMAYEWQVDPEDREAHWHRLPRRVELPEEQQGEAIAYTGTGQWLTSSEGRPMPLTLSDAVTGHPLPGPVSAAKP